MAFGVRLHVFGEWACFTRPENKVERLSYNVITPSAARGILEAIHWKPAIRWVVDGIRVLKPIRFQSIRRNEVADKLSADLIARAMNGGARVELLVEDSRQQRAARVLKDVGYIIEAHFDMTDRAGAEDSPAKHHEMFTRRAAKGQCFHQPCFGTREFPAHFKLLQDGDMVEDTLAPRNDDFGLMLHDIDFANGRKPHFFNAIMQDGLITVPPLGMAP